MKKEKINPNHHMGQQTGYTMIDGVYHIAPTYTEQFDKMRDKELGIQIIVNTTTSYFAGELAKVAETKRLVWKQLQEDIGLDPLVNWEYSNGTVTKLTQEPKKEV
jgi:hypothetical protein